MKNFKKIMALIIAAVMIVGTMSTMAFADEPVIVPEGLTADSAITIYGLDDGDEVTLYKLIEWKNNDDNTSAGWVLTEDFADDEACQEVLAKINAVTDGVYTLTKADVKAFTDVINADGFEGTPVTDGTNDEGTYTNNTVAPGMYIALVDPAIAGTLYNPIIVSADYFQQEPATSEIDASTATLGGLAGFAKKETLTVEKEQEDKNDNPADGTNNSYNVGDTVSFTVTTTIPTYAEAYTNPSFKVTDSMSDGLELTDVTLKVYDEEGNEIEALNDVIEPDNSINGWVLDVPSSYIKDLTTPQKIVIKFDAVITETEYTNVNEETNDVEVEFSNNPNDSDDKGTVKDKTRAYTFSIDGSLLGLGGNQTSELVKVAVDGNGDPIYQSSSENETYTNALAGARFALYTDSACENVYSNDEGDWDNIVTDSKGFMEINGLEEGTYYLKELTAPAGFIKDQSVHTIDISAVYGTETLEEDGYTYTVPVLTSYTITIDGVGTSTYNMTLDSSDITTSAIVEASNSLLNNTKGVELPSTGGMGTTLFYIIGAVLVIGAGIVLVTRRRMSAN